jgi:hypothetical protein
MNANRKVTNLGTGDMVMQASIISFPMIQNTTKKQGIKQSWGACRVNKNKGNLCKENV